MEYNHFICECCGKHHDGTYGSGRYCSSKCSHTRVFNEETKRKLSNHDRTAKPQKCLCGDSFSSITKLKKHQKCCSVYIEQQKIKNESDENCVYCGKYCKNRNSLLNHERTCKFNPNRQIRKSTTDNFKKYRETYGSWNKGLDKNTDSRLKQIGEKLKDGYLSGRLKPSFKGRKHSASTIAKMKEHSGGYRKTKIAYKRGFYKGYHCDSSWELAYVIYNLEHNIEFEQCNEYFYYTYKGKIHKYYPDFKEGDTYIEIKNFKSDMFEAKLKYFDRKIKVLYKDDIKMYLDYVAEKYGNDFTKMFE